MNKIMLIGNLTRDPEFSTTNSGISLCKFSIAVNRKFANSDGERETDFINIVTWRNLADNCSKFLTKGKKVCVVGSLQIRNYEGQDGSKRTAADVVAEDVEFLSARENSGETEFERPSYKTNAEPKQKKEAKLEPIEDDDLPF